MQGLSDLLCSFLDWTAGEREAIAFDEERAGARHRADTQLGALDVGEDRDVAALEAACFAHVLDPRAEGVAVAVREVQAATVGARAQQGAYPIDRRRFRPDRGDDFRVFERLH
jgi:hypothetical protein